MASTSKPLLPKSVLEMKFMKKTRERIEKEKQNTKDHESLYSDVITKEMRCASGNLITESSFIFCQELIEGRLSFKGMNPEIERLMELEDIREKEEAIDEIQKDVSDEILAKKMAMFNKRMYVNIINTPPKEPASKKRKKK